MDRNQNRLAKAQQLVEEAGGLARFAEIVGISPAQAWQIASKSPVRGIGGKMGERIERAFSKPAGWLDWPLGEEVPASAVEARSAWPFPSVPLEDIARLSEADRRDLETTIKRFVAGCLAQRKE